MLIARYGAIPREARGANMHNVAFGYALLAGVSMATYIIGLRLASSDVHPALGTAVITGIACLINVAVTLYLWAGGTPIAFSVESLRFLIVVGVATATVNLFTLLAYASGLRVTSSFVIGGTSTLLVLLVGFLFLKEPFTWAKLLAIGLIVGGTFLLRGAE
jgi:bacterial/archaeal transporter family protein